MSSSIAIRRLAVLAFGVATLCCASTSPVHAAPPDRPAPPHRPHTAPPARSSSVLYLDVIDRPGKSAAQSVRLTLPISDRGVSKLETQAGHAAYRVRIHRDGPPEPSSPLRIDLRRSDLRRLERDDPKNDVELDVSVHLERGRRAILTRLDRPDGSSTEIAATLR